MEQLLLDVGKLSTTLQFAVAARPGMSTTHPEVPDPEDEDPDQQILRKRKICMISFYLVCRKYNPTAEFFIGVPDILGKLIVCMQTNKKKKTLT